MVACDLPPYSIAVGNPAKVIRKRFDDELIELLEKLQWWNLSEKRIQKITPLLASSDLAFAKEQIKALVSDLRGG